MQIHLTINRECRFPIVKKRRLLVAYCHCILESHFRFRYKQIFQYGGTPGEVAAKPCSN